MIKNNKNLHIQSRLSRSRLLGELSRYKYVIFVVMFAAIGGAILLLSSRAAIQYAPYPTYRTACIENSPSKIVVRPGERFTARIRMKNTGSTVFNPDYGFYFTEFTSGTPIWNASGTKFYGNISPGDFFTFNLTLTAPRAIGRYNFSWSMGLTYKGFIKYACQGGLITVTNEPSVSLLVNGQSGNISITKGQSLTLSWSTSNYPSSCSASGSWSGGKPASGSENRAGDTSSAGTRTYTLSCSNAIGSSSVTRKVYVNNPPPQPPPPQPPPSQPPPTQPPPSQPSSGSSQSSRPRPGPVISPGGALPRTEPFPSNNNQQTNNDPAPQKPHTFSAIAVSDSTVRLTWYKENSDLATSSYELQRSLDNENWQTLSDYITDELYVDSEVRFSTKYYYRLRSLSADGQKSEFVNTDVTTKPFTSNTNNGDLSLESEDKQVTVLIPDGAISDPAFCSIRNDETLPSPEIRGHKLLAGPYEVLCKTADGAIVYEFNKKLSMTTQVNQGSFIALKLFGYDKGWNELLNLTTSGDSSYELNSTKFAILGQQKPKPLLFWVGLISGIVLVIVVGGFILLSSLGRYKQQRYIKNKLADYKSKERGY